MEKEPAERPEASAIRHDCPYKLVAACSSLAAWRFCGCEFRQLLAFPEACKHGGEGGGGGSRQGKQGERLAADIFSGTLDGRYRPSNSTSCAGDMKPKCCALPETVFGKDA